MNISKTDGLQRAGPSFENDRGKRWTICLLVLFPIVYAAFSQVLGQDTNWDLQNYHYFDSYWLLVNRMRDVVPARLQTYLSPFLISRFISPRSTFHRDLRQRCWRPLKERHFHCSIS